MKKLFVTLSAVLLLSIQVSAQDFETTQADFKTLFNQYRIAQPGKLTASESGEAKGGTPWAGSYFAYSGNGTALVTGSTSPIQAYDAYVGRTEAAENAYKWEVENHTCDKLKGEEKTSCESWWGHCNGWAAAAVKEPEPRTPLTSKGQIFSVADQKGILTEMWLSSNSLFEGETDKITKTSADWVYSENKKPAAYRAFWDVNPRTFFLIFTNYIGIQKVGVVIDRFTGEEVWNQPVVGYRILPLRAADIVTIDADTHVLLRMKIYWANDLNTPPNHVSTIFDINQTTDSEALEPLAGDYEGRLLTFKLSFNGPVTVSPDGKQVLSAGRMVGQGLWSHREKPLSAQALNQTHPDFIWLPTLAVQDTSGYGNPFVSPREVARIFAADTSSPPPTSQVKSYYVSVAKQGVTGATPAAAGKFLRKILIRDAIKSSVKEVKFVGNAINFTVVLPGGEDSERVKATFTMAGLTVNSITAK